MGVKVVKWKSHFWNCQKQVPCTDSPMRSERKERYLFANFLACTGIFCCCFCLFYFILFFVFGAWGSFSLHMNHESNLSFPDVGNRFLMQFAAAEWMLGATHLLHVAVDCIPQFLLPTWKTKTFVQWKIQRTSHIQVTKWCSQCMCWRTRTHSTLRCVLTWFYKLRYKPLFQIRHLYSRLCHFQLQRFENKEK